MSEPSSSKKDKKDKKAEAPAAEAPAAEGAEEVVNKNKRHRKDKRECGAERCWRVLGSVLTFEQLGTRTTLTSE
jgi:hypothetical protein